MPSPDPSAASGPDRPGRPAKPAASRPRLSVDRASPVPLYYQIAQQLEAAIDSGRLEHGSLLGNEIELADSLGLSRPTVRQAIQSLVDKGLLVRRRGVGTQVVHTRVKRPLELSSLYDDLSGAGQRPASRVLGFDTVECGAEAARALGVPEGTPVLLLERLRFAQGEPIARMRNHLPVDVFGAEAGVPEAAQLERDGLYRLLRAAGVRMHSARQTVGARTAAEGEAEELQEEPGAPLLTMERTTFDERGRVVEFGSHLYRASRYSFEFSLLSRG